MRLLMIYFAVATPVSSALSPDLSHNTQVEKASEAVPTGRAAVKAGHDAIESVVKNNVDDSFKWWLI